MTEEVNTEKLAKIYVKIRDKRRELEKQVADLKEQQDVVASQLLEICKAEVPKQYVRNLVRYHAESQRITGQATGILFSNFSKKTMPFR